MEKRLRLLAKVQNGPRSVRFNDLVALMKAWEFEEKIMKSGDGSTFINKGFGLLVNAGKPHHGPVGYCYVKECIAAIEEIQVREAGTDD